MRSLQPLAAGVALALAHAPATAPANARLEAVVLDAEVAEISGMANGSGDVLWVVNDSGNGARVFALGHDGRVRSAYDVEGVANVDWEDVADFTHAGKRHLAIADTGDNGGLRTTLELVVIAEPEVREHFYQGSVTPAWTVRFRWPDGPRDCEAVAIDPVTGDALLFSKKRVPAQLFRVSVAPPKPGEGVRVAEPIAVAAGIPQPDAAELAAHPQSGRYRGQITALDVSRDGRALAVLTYRDVYLYRRGEGESWRDALLRQPRALGMPPIVQAEAAALTPDGRAVRITSENLPAPLFRVDLPR